MAHSRRILEISNTQRLRARRSMWFWRGILVSAVTHSLLAAADFSVVTDSVWSEVGEAIDLHSAPTDDTGRKIAEFDLRGDISTSAEVSQKGVVIQAGEIVEGLRFPARAAFVEASFLSASLEVKHPEQESIVLFKSNSSSAVQFPVDVPVSEVVRVSRTFNGMVQESMRQTPGQLSRQFLGSLSNSAPMTDEKLAELETTLIDESVSEDGYALGQEVDSQSELGGLDPFKTYTVVNGRIHSVTPTQIVRQSAAPSSVASNQVESSPVQSASGANVLATKQSAASLQSSTSELSLSEEEVSKGMSDILSSSRSAALDSASVDADRVTIQGRVSVPAGFAPDKVVLRMAGTSFQVQADASGAFELRDVPRGTRFELLVWHIDGSLTRRLIPVTASGREKSVEIALQKTSDVDTLATSFGLLQKMNQGGFCARVESESKASLTGAQVTVTTGRKNHQAHFFSESGLPVSSLSELTSDGRFCVFNVDDSLVDVRVILMNGSRRQFVVHVEPSTFEHDLIFDVAESIYRRVTLMEPLDTQQVLELSAEGVQPDFGDRRLRDWLQGDDVPVWTRVAKYVLQSDPSYAGIRPNLEDVQFFPGGQEFVELRMAPDLPGAPWSRVILSRDELMTKSLLKQTENLKSRIFQDSRELMSVAALDADAWDDLAAHHVEIPRLQGQTIGGLYVSVDPFGLGAKAEDLVVSVRDTWTGKDVCPVVLLLGSKEIRSARYLRAVCGASPGQYALIIETKAGALLWSDVVRIRPGGVQTVTVHDPKF